MALTQLDIANRAISEIAKGNLLTGGDVSTNFDGTTAGINAALLYPGAVDMLLRQQDWEFSQTSVALTDTGASGTIGFSHEYLYPADCLRIRQVYPLTWDKTDPQPIVWDVGVRVISSIPTRIILANLANAQLTYTTSNVTEDDWDSVFTEQMVRYLGSQLALPVAGRPDFGREMLKIAGGLGQAGQDKDS